jgi:hypothetical protein
MKRYRSTIIKFIYPPVFIICFIHGFRLYQAIVGEYQMWIDKRGSELDFKFRYSMYILTFQVLFGLFFIFLVISFILLLKPPTMKKYKTSLKTVLEYENRNEDVLEDQGHEMRKETDYRLSAKRVYCPTCGAPTEGVVGSSLTCASCGEVFEVT